jgi:hypothetical protein
VAPRFPLRSSRSIDAAYADHLPVCRELRTAAGRIDCLFVTRLGGLVIVECKLWRNPQARREVVGQILDSVKEIATWDYGDLQRESQATDVDADLPE